MVREYLPAVQRRAQILDAALTLFVTKGYEATTIEDILSAVGIAKGTLYHHFNGKEAILTALLNRTVEGIVERAQEVAAGDGSALEKFLGVIAAARVEHPEELGLADQFEAAGNAQFHVRSFIAVVEALTPLLTRVVEEGNETGEFHADHPRESAEIILTAGMTLLDGGFFPAEPERMQRRLVALAHTCEKVLGFAPGEVERILWG